MEIGEEWGYREHPYTDGEPLIRVELLQFGPKRSQKVRIRYLEGEYHGLDVWVPRVRLRVLWDDADDWLDDERRWMMVRECSLEAAGSVDHRAALDVINSYPYPDDLYLEDSRNKGAILEVANIERVCSTLQIERSELESTPVTFVDRHGNLIAPWSVALQIAKRVASTYPDRVLGCPEHP